MMRIMCICNYYSEREPTSSAITTTAPQRRVMTLARMLKIVWLRAPNTMPVQAPCRSLLNNAPCIRRRVAKRLMSTLRKSAVCSRGHAEELAGMQQAAAQDT